jgi:flagellar L-ring protein precursor FlgH
MRRLLILPVLGLTACGANLAEVGRPPAMSPVGEGLHANAYALPPPTKTRAGKGYHSTWDSSADLYRDPRAFRTGDLLTVTISIDDKAKLDNKTDRSRDSKTKFGFDYLFNLGNPMSGNAETNVGSTTSAKGAGSIDRTEQINLSVGVMVTRVAPNGNMLISGSQEVLVNQEIRVLHVSGIVRPRDISKTNTIPYDKITEARISYGGRGRLMEVQHPGWGHQIYDQLVPF